MSDNASEVLDNANVVLDNANVVLDNTNIVPDNNNKKNRRRRKKKVKKDTQDKNNVNKNVSDPLKAQAPGDPVSNAGKDGQRKKKKRQRRRSRWDIYYGRFQCRICRRSWDSAFVFTVAGTKKVLWRQRCKNCTAEDAWMFPYRLELLRCSVCGSQVCECKCDECGKLIHLRYIFTEIQQPEEKKKNREERKVDTNFEYCDCPDNKRNKAQVGAHIDVKKRHLSHLCQKCINGLPCTGMRSSDDGGDDDEEYPEDNEP